MVKAIARIPDRPPPSRLESWLVRELQGGFLKALPRYFPLGVQGGRCPEQYARELLTGLRSAREDVLMLERLKDDGRAFRSWAESASMYAPPRADSRAAVLGRGYITG